MRCSRGGNALDSGNVKALFRSETSFVLAAHLDGPGQTRTRTARRHATIGVAVGRHDPEERGKEVIR